MIRLSPSAFLTFVIVMILSLGSMTRASESPKTCSANLYSDKCEDLSKKPLDLRKDKTEADGVLFNYFLAGKREHVHEIRALNASASHDQAQRGLEIAKEVRAEAIKLVTGGRTKEDLPPEVAAIAERLQTVTFTLSNPTDPSCYDKGDPGIPNASYSQLEHRISICPATLKVPTEEIAATIAHELGHSITPCAMSRALIKLEEIDTSLGSCLLNIGEGDNRSKEDQEIWGTGAISIAMISDTGYTVDIYPEKNSELIRCGAASRLPGSQVINPSIYKSISSCLDTRYAKDYENYLAKETLQLDKMPDFSKLPGKAKTEWPKLVAQARKEKPFSCFVKKEEHFADAFGGQAYSAWGKTKNLTAKRFDTGLHFLTNIQCVEKITKSLTMASHIYPPVADRIALFLKPNAISDLKQCEPAQETLCTLAEDAFTQGMNSPGRSKGTRSGGTAP